MSSRVTILLCTLLYLTGIIILLLFMGPSKDIALEALNYPITISVCEPVLDTDGIEVTILENFQVTFYGPTGNEVSTGGLPIEGETIATDPKIIPMYTHVDILLPGGKILHRVARDTGGAVKGKIVDIFENSPDAVLLQKGRMKNITVILYDGGCPFCQNTKVNS